jgi:hypothetical protein
MKSEEQRKVTERFAINATSISILGILVIILVMALTN